MGTLVLGGTGLAGSAISAALMRSGYDVSVTSSRDADLRDISQVRRLLSDRGPTLVIHAAGRVGGIEANLEHGLELGLDNALITVNVLKAAAENGINKLIYLGSGCCYPNDRSSEMGLDDLFAGPVESSSRAYALAKSIGIELVVRARADGKAWTTVIPANLYGPRDDFDLERSHVVAGVMRRVHDAKMAGTEEVVLWGTGAPIRQFLHSSDLGSAVAVIAGHLSSAEAVLNVAGDSKHSVLQLATEMIDVVRYGGRVSWDRARPDGTPVKLLEDSRVRELGWTPSYDLRSGLSNTYAWFTQALEVGAVRGDLTPASP